MAFARRIQQSRAMKVAAPMVMVPWALRGDRSPSMPTVLIALGLNKTIITNINDWPQPFTHLKHAVRFAMWYVERQMNHLIRNNTAARAALIMGELMASWAIPDTIDNGTIEAARGSFKASLAADILDGPTIARAASFLLREAKTFNVAQTLTRAEFCAGLGIDEDQRIPAICYMQRYYWLKRRGNCIPYEGFFGVEARVVAWVESLNDITNNDYVMIGDVPDIQVTGDYANQWRNATEDQKMGCLEAVSVHDSLTERAVIVAASFHVLVMLAKQGNVTEEWILSRRDRVKALAPELDIERWITTDTIREFKTWYPIESVSADKAYSMLQAFYTWMTEDTIGPYQWIIEQSATANITLAVAFCEAVSKALYNPIGTLRQYISMDQFKVVAYICMAIQYDRFISLQDPPKKMQEYADLAYIGKFVAMQNKGRASTGYEGDPTPWITMSENELKKIAKAAFELSDAPISAAGDFESHIRKYLPHVGIVKVGKDWFVVENPGDLPAGANEGQRASHAAHSDLRAQCMMGKTVEHNDVDVPVKELDFGWLREQYNNAQDAISKALLTIFKTLMDNARQLKLETIADNRANGNARQRAIPPNLLDLCTTIGLVIPDDWRTNPAPINPINIDPACTDRTFNLLSRNVVIIPPAPGIQGMIGQQPLGANNNQVGVNVGQGGANQGQQGNL